MCAVKADKMSTLTRIFNRSLDEHVVLRWTAIAFILMLSAILGWQASSRLVVIVPAVIVALVLFSVKPELGLALILAAALSIPIDLETGTRSTLPISTILVAVMAVLWVLRMLSRQQVSLVASRVNLPIIVFSAAATISFLSGGLSLNLLAEHAPIEAQAAGWAILILSCVSFLLAGNQIKDIKWLKALVAIFLILGAVLVLGHWLPAFRLIAGDLITPGAENSSSVLFWIVALAGGQALFNSALKLRGRLLLGSLAALTVMIIYASAQDWLSGWLPALIVLVTLLMLRSWRAALVFVVLGTVGFALLRSDQLFNVLVSNDNVYSLNTRWAALQILVTQVLPASPIIGLGFANYWHYTVLYPILGWYVNFNSHNNYLDILMQMGVVGLIVFAWLTASIGRVAVQLRTRVGDGFARGYVYGCLAGLVGMLFAGLLGDWFFPFVYNVGLSGTRGSLVNWIFLGGLIAIEQMIRRQPESANVA